MTTRKLLTVALSLFFTLAAVSTVSAKGDNEFTTSAIKKGKVLESCEHDSTKKKPGIVRSNVCGTRRIAPMM